MASSIYANLHLARGIAKAASTHFQNHRRCQVAFASIVCATRFKIFLKEGLLQPAQCVKSGEQNSFDHLMSCSQVGLVPREGAVEQLQEFLDATVLEA